jgi:acyl carrier protein
MSSGTAIDDAIRDLLCSRAPLARDRADLPDNLRLGAGGLALDSIALVELLLDCERRFGIRAAAELLAGEPLTVGRLADHVRAAVSRAVPR